MTTHHDDKARTGLESPERRRFLDISAKFGFTTAAVVSGGGLLFSEAAVAQSAQEEQTRKRLADFTMNLATPYRLGASRSYPIMQLAFKENIQNLTHGRVYVKLVPGGVLGAGMTLVKKVQNNTIQAAQHSIANFAPFAPAVDLINIPYWCGDNQPFVNLVTSDTWKKTVDSQVLKNGFKPLWYVTIDPRAVSVRDGFSEPIRTPDDMHGVNFRVNASHILQKVYSLMGANPTPIAWGETTAAIKQGVADALDPSVNALYVFGFKDVLSYVTFTKQVADSQVYSCNLKWFQSLPRAVQDSIEFASEVTFRQNLAKVPAARAYSKLQMAQAGVKYYDPTPSEMAQWKAACGYQLETWDPLKKKLAGSLDAFDRLLQATETENGYVVAER